MIGDREVNELIILGNSDWGRINGLYWHREDKWTGFIRKNVSSDWLYLENEEVGVGADKLVILGKR